MVGWYLVSCRKGQDAARPEPCHSQDDTLKEVHTDGADLFPPPFSFN